MTAYRFCRTDDMGLLVAAYEGCRGVEDVVAPVLDRDSFKSLVRGLDLWCSSCMVAFEGREPVGVLLGAKRAEATLVYGLRVNPEHRRRGHGRHLLTSLGQKLAILGPDRLVAEVPAERTAACELFSACGWEVENRLVDWHRAPAGAGTRAPAAAGAWTPIAPISLDDLLHAGLLTAGTGCWQRDVPALLKLGEQVHGLGFFSPERLEAWLLFRPEKARYEVLAAGFSPGELGRPGLEVLVDELASRAGTAPLVLPRASPREIDPEVLAALGFRPGAEHLLFATRAQAA